MNKVYRFYAGHGNILSNPGQGHIILPPPPPGGLSCFFKCLNKKFYKNNIIRTNYLTGWPVQANVRWRSLLWPGDLQLQLAGSYGLWNQTRAWILTFTSNNIVTFSTRIFYQPPDENHLNGSGLVLYKQHYEKNYCSD